MHSNPWWENHPVSRGAQLGEGAKNMQEFIDRCVTFCEVDCENNLNNILTGAFLGKTILLLEGFDHCAMIDAKKFMNRASSITMIRRYRR